MYPVSFPCGLLHDIYRKISHIPLWCISLLPVPRLHSNLGMIPGYRALYGCIIRLHYTVALYGCIIRLHYTVALYGCIIRLHYMVALYGCIIWLHYMVALYGCMTSDWLTDCYVTLMTESHLTRKLKLMLSFSTSLAVKSIFNVCTDPMPTVSRIGVIWMKLLVGEYCGWAPNDTDGSYM